jgi:hypothetical protein
MTWLTPMLAGIAAAKGCRHGWSEVHRTARNPWTPAPWVRSPGGAKERRDIPPSGASIAPPGLGDRATTHHGFRPPLADSTRGYSPSPLRGVETRTPFVAPSLRRFVAAGATP